MASETDWLTDYKYWTGSRDVTTLVTKWHAYNMEFTSVLILSISSLMLQQKKKLIALVWTGSSSW